MSELKFAFDLYPRDDPRDGARILRFSDLTEAEWNAEANGTGSGVIILPGDSPDAASIDPRGLQYIRVVEIDPDTVDGATLSGFAERVVHGFFLDTGSFDALTEQNTKRLTFGGAGTLSYWARAVMAPHTYIHAVFTGQDPFDRTWRLDQQSTVFANGNYTGAMLWRVLYELSHFRSGATYTHKHADGIIYNDAHDDDRTESAVPDAVIDFTAFLDSNGNAWTEKVGEFRVSVLDNGLSVIRLLMELGAYVEMDPDTFETRAYQASSHRRDRTGGAWGASVIRFQSPTDGTLATGNILSDAKRALTAHIQRSTMWAGGGDDTYAKATGTFDIPWEGGLNSDANDLDALEVQADRQITARSDAGDTLRVRTVPIDNPANGLYRPLHSTGILLDDLATVHNGSGQWDFDEQTFPVAAVGAKLREGGDWDTFFDLGASFRPMEGRQFQVPPLGSHTHLLNPLLCEPSTPGTAEIVTSQDFLTWDTADEYWASPYGGDSAVVLTRSDNGPYSGGGDGTAYTGDFVNKVVGSGPRRTVTASQTLRISGWSQGYGESFACTAHGFINWSWGVVFWTAAGVEISRHVVASYENKPWTIIPGDLPTWEGPASLDVAVPSTAAYMTLAQGISALGCQQNSTRLDQVRISTVVAAGEGTPGDGHPDLIGTATRAKRCSDTEHYHTTADPTVDDDWSLGFRNNTLWINETSGAMFLLLDNTTGAADWLAVGGAGADLSGINFLVGTASGDLSAEIVVGTTPGGELGGTWASPTVDATHSGSAHHTESHQARHADGGADEVAVEGLPTAETDTALVLHPDGTGGIVWGTDEGGGSGIAGELVTDTIIGDGVEDTFALSAAPTGSWALVSTNGADLLPTEYAISGGDIVFDVAPVNLAEVLVTFIVGGFTVPAVDPGDIADPTLATAEDAALKVNALMANLRTAGIIV